MKSKGRHKTGLKKASSTLDETKLKNERMGSEVKQYPPPKQMGHHGTDAESTLNPEE